jgi:hypothetical protein
MARGGYRPGAGRPKGAKGKAKPSEKEKPNQTDAEKIKQMLSLGAKAKARFYQEFLIRVSKGEKLTVAEQKAMTKLGDELAADGTEKKPTKAKRGKKLDPLAYMLAVMNDETEDPDMRARMAIAAAPYIHSRAGESAGKKQEKADRAKKAGAGKFAQGKAPLQVVR